MSETAARVRTELGAKRVRAYLGGEVVADTTRPLLVWDVPHYPAYYLPEGDVALERLAPDAYKRSTHEELAGYVNLRWDAMDAWFEEDEEVFVHPRSPYTRVDILPSSRHIRVEVDGVTVAESTSARLLFETGLPVRYYLPKTDVRMDLLTPTDTSTGCPYKGFASYWSLDGRADLAWSYPTPLPESEGIAGLVCFYNEKVDIYVDGVREERPKTKFS